MANILKEDTFFNLSEQEDYTSALNYIIDTLEKRGYVDADFKERVWEKESRSSMTIDNIAIPHAVQKAGDSIVLSVGEYFENQCLIRRITYRLYSFWRSQKKSGMRIVWFVYMMKSCHS